MPPSPARPGAHFQSDDARRGTTFVAWTTRAREVAVRLFDEHRAPIRTAPLDANGEGVFSKTLADVREGALYCFVLDGDEVTDPYARFLPFGVHGPARVVSPSGGEGLKAALAHQAPAPTWVIYELHVGTFSPEGTYRGAEARLDALAELGITAIEVLPLAAFDGARGWGYDGVALYAPHAAYGEPEELRSFVRAAHQRGIAVVLDVVYNHFGPAGNYLSRYAEEYFTRAVNTPWGPAPDFTHAPMRSLALDNARYWLEEYGFDGLRLDATHAVHDASSVHVLRELTDLAHAMTPPRRIFFEDERNDPDVVRELGADGVWADDFHHHVHVLLTGERDGYYAAYAPTVAALADVINGGWSFTGQPFSPWKGRPRGKPARPALLPEQLVYCLQNHDQVGNRAHGTRLTEHVDLEGFAAASVLLLFLPATPLVFMGQEWGASSPFLFFSDHEGALGEAIRRGRREEFKSFAAFSDPARREAIPDPQDARTFERSRLAWEERGGGNHARLLALHRAMIALRRTDPVLSSTCRWEDLEASSHDDVLEVVRRRGADTRRLVVNFGSSPEPLTLSPGTRVLYASREVEASTLPPRAAVVLAEGSAP